MGVLETIGAVATALTALVGLALKLWIDHKRKQAEKKAENLKELGAKLQAAQTDEERQKYAEELYRLRAK